MPFFTLQFIMLLYVYDDVIGHFSWKSPFLFRKLTMLGAGTRYICGMCTHKPYQCYI